jgi:hypothetical protein
LNIFVLFLTRPSQIQMWTHIPINNPNQPNMAAAL